MGWLKNMSNNIKKGIRNWLQVQPASTYAINIQQIGDFELSAIRNRIWYRGDGNELEQMYMQNTEFADKTKFWASKCSSGMEMRKIHTGLPSLIVRTLSSIILADMNDFEFSDDAHKQTWESIEKETKFRKIFEKSLKETLYIGDGAYKITVDTDVSKYPILEWYAGDRVEYIYNRGKIREVVFKTQYTVDFKQYVLHEHYGYGYINNHLYLEEKEVDLKSIDVTKDLESVTFDKSIILAVPLMIFENTKYEGRGGSIYDGKLDNFDAFDEAWSQWMDALRTGRAKEYIPDNLIPRDPNNGELLKPNPFDNRFIKIDSLLGEDTKNVITLNQPEIPHESYLATYCTALDLCLQGIISPSTLGIDVKKLDNAEAQREKEKTTLYTRNAIIEALQETLPELVSACINAARMLNDQGPEEIEVNIPFGEYANPSFESQVETVGKGKTQGIMSIEACVEELYGDSKDKEWKKEEIARLKAEQGIATVEEPGVNLTAGNFNVNLEEKVDEGKGIKQNVPNE